MISTRDNDINEFRVDGEFFAALFDAVKHVYGGEYWVEEIDYDIRMEYEKEDREKEAKKPRIPKDTVWKALHRMASRKELEEIRSDEYQYENDYYYDFDILIGGVRAFMTDKISVGYFEDWCGVLVDCLMSHMNCEKDELSVFRDLGWYLDGAVFDSKLFGKRKSLVCREMIAWIKHYDHVLRDLKNKTTSDFTTNGVITYVSFGFGLNGGSDRMDRVCVVDKVRETINYMYVRKVDYSDDINYTFLSKAEFDDLPCRYYQGYALDVTMGQKYAAKGNRAG